MKDNNKRIPVDCITGDIEITIDKELKAKGVGSYLFSTTSFSNNLYPVISCVNSRKYNPSGRNLWSRDI